MRYMVVLIALLAAACGGGSQTPTLRLYDGGYEASWVENVVLEVVLEVGYGQPVRFIETSQDRMPATLIEGTMDLALEGWQTNWRDRYTAAVEAGRVVNVGASIAASQQVWVIPRATADELQIRRPQDLAVHAERFADPRSSDTHGIFYSCVASWPCAQTNEIKLEAYGLAEAFRIVTPPDQAALEAALADGHRQGRPVVGYFWTPSPLLGEYDWKVLEEPGYHRICWSKILSAADDASLRPIDEGCAYPTFQVDKLASGLTWGAFSRDVRTAISRVSFGVDQLNTTLAWAVNNDMVDQESARPAARHFLEANRNLWTPWVNESAAKRILEWLGS